jgi:hypothetical protein
MKTRTYLFGGLVLLLTTTCLQAAETKTFTAKPGSKVRIDGTANMIHTHWAVQSPIIAGVLEAGPGFPTEPGQTVSPGKVQAKVECSIPARSLKSIEDDGKPYSDAMDDVMYKKLKVQESPKIIYRLTDLTLKEAAKDKASPYVFDSKGEVVVGGITNVVTFPVSVLPMEGDKLKVSGNTSLKMTDFKIDPPAPKIALGALKTGNDVKISFDWILALKPSAAGAAK